MKSKFEKINSIGPTWVANFEEMGDSEVNEMLQRDAFERVNAFLDKLNIKPYEE